MADVSSFEVLVEGELHSQSKSTFLWHKRNFALCSDNTFRRYSNSQRLRNSAAINALTVVTKGSRGTDFNLTFSSAISLPILRYSLRAATPHDRDVWVDVLLACIEHARASGSESDTPSPSHVSTIASVRRTNHTTIPDWAQYDDGDAAAPSRSSSAPVHLHAEPSPALLRARSEHAPATSMRPQNATKATHCRRGHSLFASPVVSHGCNACGDLVCFGGGMICNDGCAYGVCVNCVSDIERRAAAQESASRETILVSFHALPLFALPVSARFTFVPKGRFSCSWHRQKLPNFMSFGLRAISACRLLSSRHQAQQVDTNFRTVLQGVSLSLRHFGCLWHIALALACFEKSDLWAAILQNVCVKKILLWKSRRFLTCRATLWNNSQVQSVAFHFSNNLLVTGSSDNLGKIWQFRPDGASASCCSILDGHLNTVTCVAFSALRDAHVLATGSLDRTVMLWSYNADGSGATRIATIEDHTGCIQSVAFSPFSPRFFASASWDDTARLYLLNPDGSSPKCCASLTGHTNTVLSVAFSPLALLLATASGDRTIKIWGFNSDGKSPMCLATLQGHSGIVNCVSFHPSMNLIASGSLDKTIRLWTFNPDGTAAACAAILEGHLDTVLSLSFSPNFRDVLASGSQDGTGRLWSFKHGDSGSISDAKCTSAFIQGTAWVNSVAFHPFMPGLFLAAGSQNRTAQLFN